MKGNEELAGLIADVKEQVLYLQELGVEHLNADCGMRIAEFELHKPVRSHGESELQKTAELQKPARSKGVNPMPGFRLADLPSLSKRTAVAQNSANIETADSGQMAKSTPETLFEIAPTPDETSETIEQIRADIGNCTRCDLCEKRTQVVHTTGNFRASLMFIGEAPGEEEDKQGFPFVGRAGQLLTKIIEGMGFRREDVCIGNVNRCRPPGNRQPTLPEAETCKPFLLREIAVVRPKVIVVMGNTATQNLLDTKIGITRLRGNFQDYFGVKVMPTFHPAFLLRDPRKKKEVWEDMKKVRDYLKGFDPE